LIGIVPGFGVTTIVASGPGVTMTVAVPVTPLHVTVTVFVKVPATVPAVKTPVEELIVPPPLATDQVSPSTLTAFPSSSVPVTVNCCVPPMARVADAGVTVSVANLWGPELSPHAANNPATTTASRLRVVRPYKGRARTKRLLAKKLIEILRPENMNARGTEARQFSEAHKDFVSTICDAGLPTVERSPQRPIQNVL
jgi:hypothetical protein